MKQFTSYRFVWYKQKWLYSALVTCSLLLLFSPVCLFSQAPTIQWNKTIGGNNNDNLLSLRPTSYGGYISGGHSNSDISGDKTENSRGVSDYWVIKLDADGNKVWDKTIGGNLDDLLWSVQQTADGGYILGGYSLSGISGDKTENSKGFRDYWIVKLDAFGNKVWDKTIGGNNNDELHALQQTADGGYILGGNSLSGISGDKTENSKGLMDYWIVKLDALGNKVWDKTIGGNFDDLLWSLQQTSEGGYILGGDSRSSGSGDKTENSKGGNDYWVIKLDENGVKVWDKTIGGNNLDFLRSLQQISEEGYLLGGYSNSDISGDKTESNKGNEDYWVVKLDADGIKVWDKTIGGSNSDILKSLLPTSDDGCIIGGYSNSDISGDKTENGKGLSDYWVTKLDAHGIKVWDKTIGGSLNDILSSICETDGTYIMGGYSPSSISGDKTENSKGSSDYWVVKLNPESTPTLTINCTPYVNLCYNASQTYTVPPLEITGDLGIESISYTVYPFPGLIGPCPDNPEVYCLVSLRSGVGADASGSFPQQESSFGTATSYDIVWNVLDANGNSHYCQTRVSIYLQITIDVPDFYAVNPGGNINTIYLGYGPSSLTLTAQATGGNPDPDFTYNWSTGQTGSTITVSPNTVGTHTYTVAVTDATGCTSSVTKTITVVNIQTPGKPGKVNICHRDLKGKRTTLSVLTGSVAEHLAHGDYLGQCVTTATVEAEITTQAVGKPTSDESVLITQQIKLFPNPADKFLNIEWSAKTSGPASISIKDVQGRVIKKVQPGLIQQNTINRKTISLEGLAKGIYILELRTGSDIRVSKFVVQ